MLSLEAKTKLKPEEVIQRALDFFGPKGYKLAVRQKSPECAYFEGGGGGVEINVCLEGKQTTVSFTSNEWDSQVKEFVGNLK